MKEKNVSPVASKCTVNKEFSSEIIEEDYFLVLVSSCQGKAGVWTSSLNFLLSSLVCNSVTITRTKWKGFSFSFFFGHDNNISVCSRYDCLSHGNFTTFYHFVALLLLEVSLPSA